jgi:hypothetical protein
MKIQTVGDLRELLVNRDKRELQIGELKLKIDTSGSDIDINFGYHLIAWIDHNVSGEALLSELKLNISYENFKQIGNKGNDDDPFETPSKPELVENKNSKEDYFKGKVDAYENLLISRKIQID